MSVQPCQVLIAGAGPAGLAAALMLIERGWRDIVLLERRRAPDAYERGKAFNYQLDGRGQRILERVGIEAKTLRQYGLPNDHFTQVVFQADGSHRENAFPALLPDRKTPYWMTRARMLEMLQEQFERMNGEAAVTLRYGVQLKGLKRSADRLCVEVSDAEGAVSRYEPRLILACDGLHSAVRRGLGELDTDVADAFRMRVHPSPSAELAYKVLNFPPSFDVNGSERAVSDHTLAYCFMSRHREPGRRMALFALPVPNADEPRNINVILHRSHRLWQLEGAQQIEVWLKDSFPQLDFDSILAPGELEAFAALDTSCFPQPQYSPRIHYACGAGQGGCDVLLLGDAARAFPPDLGMGVNAALEDVFILAEQLDSCGDDIGAACQGFATRRLPENRALVKLVQTVHPYQYNQVPWRLKLWFLKFLVQRALHRWSRGRIPEPPFVLTQKHLLNFVEMRRRARSADAAFYAALTLPLFLLALLFV